MSERKPATIDENNLYENAGLRKILLEEEEDEDECVETLNKRFEISSIKSELSITIRLLTGHGLFKSHCKNIGVGSDANCRFCGEDGEDCLHLLCDCPALAMLRPGIPAEGTTCEYRGRRAT
ncbi:hypothetical protein PV326_014117 [Microctonus aethiopoides]|nr:hypothetical protein PV326_014117 [Microctonus aethiopoides]